MKRTYAGLGFLVPIANYNVRVFLIHGEICISHELIEVSHFMMEKKRKLDICVEYYG